MLLPVIAAIFLLFYFLLIGFYYYHWRQLENFAGADTGNTPISVIIPARNEEETLPHLLRDITSQNYPPGLFEVIIVNDYSTDRTGDIDVGLSGNMKMILPDALPQHSSKKAAITTAITNATGELMVVTDADCRVSPSWLSTIEGYYRKTQARFIAAPVRYETNGSLLQVFQALDFLTLQGITAASVQANFHTLCNGANLAYTREAFLHVDGFRDIDHVATGDDLLLMHKIWKKDRKRVLYLKSKDVIVSTTPMQTWRSFFMQRKRWASKTFIYEDRRIMLVLTFVYLFNCLFLVLLIAALANAAHWQWFFGYWVLKTLIELPFVYSVAGFFNQRKLLRYFFIFQPLHAFYILLVGLISQAGKYEWKGRTTK